MNTKRMICALLCAALLTASGCGKAQTPSADGMSEPQTETAVQIPTETAAESTETSVPATETAEESTTEADAFDPHDGLNSTDVAEVLAFYQWAASYNDKSQYTKTLRLISIDGGSEKINKRLDIFEPIAKKAVEKNSITGDVLPGKYAAIKVSDWQSASAVSDGEYTTLTIQVAPQTDGAFGKEFDGPVGRSMTVLNGIAVAIDEMPGVSADFENGDVAIEYLHPTIKVKVDNRTGLFVPGTCSWSYRVHPVLYSLDAKVLAFTVHLQNASGYIDYTMSY